MKLYRKLIKFLLIKFLKNHRDKHTRFTLLTQIGKTLLPEYRFNWPFIDWWQDQFFNEYLERFGELKSFNMDKRMMLYQLMRLTENVPGDTAECGTLNGAASYFICLMNDRSGVHERWHHIFDSFEGLSNPSAEDGEHWDSGDLSVPEDEVRANLTEFQAFTLHKGWIPERFDDVSDRKFSFVHIDVDLFQPTLDSMMFFYERMNPGGIILCDDYGSSLCPGATRAVNLYLTDKHEKMLYLPASGGFMIKGCHTAGQIQ